MATYTVTGGGGFLGKAVVRQLLEQGNRVTSFSRNRYPELEVMGVRQVQGDVSDPGGIAEAVKGADGVFHVAAKAGIWGDYEGYYHANVIGTRNVISACVDAGIPWLIHTSSPSVVFDGGDMEGVDESVPYPETYHAPYPETKAAAEKMVRKAGQGSLLTLSLRPHLIWGPEDNHLFPGIVKRAKRLRRIGDGTNRVDTIHVENAAQAHLLAAAALTGNPSLSGNVYFISQDEPVRLWDMVDAFLDVAGLPPVSKTVSPAIAYGAGRFFERIYKGFNIRSEPPMTGFAAKELATSHWFDISRAKKDLGYKPVISIAQGLEEMKRWYRTQGGGL